MKPQYLRLAAGVVLGLLVAQLAAADQPKVRFRDLVSKYFEDGNGADLAKVVGWEKPVKEVVALEYKVLLFQNGREQTVDPKTHQFKIGDRIRVTIEPFDDAYVYIFHTGASGKSCFLLPREDREPPEVKAHEKVALPSDGYFEFVAPPGNEKIVVVATQEPVADRDMLANVLTKSPNEYTPEEAAMSKTINATVEGTLKSFAEREREVRNRRVNFRGLPGTEQHQDMIKDAQARGVTAGTVEEPAQELGEGTVAIYLSPTEGEGRGPNLSVTIPLKSTGSTRVSR